LIVDASEPIGLPLEEPDAQRIIASCHEAPFGKAIDTIVDPNIRRTWELNADGLESQHGDEWAEFVEGLVPVICHSLGIDEEVVKGRAEVYKLLLYEEGAHFKPHTE
jgi:hypothetical protein